MLNLIIVTDAKLRDALVSHVSGVRQTNMAKNVIFYQKNNYIFAFSETLAIAEIFRIAIEECQPEKIFLAETARSVDVDHEIGDIILPNVFLRCHENLDAIELNNENRDDFMGKAKFLETFDEQKDYFVEDFWLSIGGIIVGNTPADADAEKLLMVYEADVYSEKNFDEIHALAENTIVPTIAIIGIIMGKKSTRHAEKNPFTLVAENMMTTIRMIQDTDE